MEHSRKQKLLMIIALVMGIVSLSVGFAAFSVSLNISSSASVTPSSDTFKVKFSTNKDSLVVSDVVASYKSSGITATNGVIDNSTNPTIKGLSATFTEPGQYVEYTFYARNEGEYTAYLNNINYLGNNTCEDETGTTSSLVQSACDDFNITITVAHSIYTGNELVTNHALASGAGEEINIRIVYSSNGAYVDGPFSVALPNIALVYSTIDDSSIQPVIPSDKVVQLVSGNLNDPGSIVSIGDEQFYVFGQEDGNVKLLSMYNLHVGNSVDFDSDFNLVVTPLSSPTGIQDEETISEMSVVNGNPTNVPLIGATVFSNLDSTYLGSIVEGYVNNYASYLEGLGVNIKEVRLITKEELEKLGCSGDDHSCSEAPAWVYDTSYWTESVVDSSDVWFVNFDSGFGFCMYNYDSGLGVRPVIEIPLSEF